MEGRDGFRLCHLELVRPLESNLNSQKNQRRFRETGGFFGFFILMRLASSAPVYGWFTEGFDTLDLKEAKALLDELAESERVLSLRHPGLAHAFDDAVAYREIDGIVAKWRRASEPCRGELRIEGESSLGRGPRLIRTAENRQGRGEKDMAHWIVRLASTDRLGQRIASS